MRGIYTPVTDIRRKVFTEVARMAYEVNELSDYEKLMRELPFKIIPGEEKSLRSSIFLERAIISERVRLAMGMSLRPLDESVPASEGLEHSVIADKYYEPPLINVIKFACNACPEKVIKVTAMCQGCLAHPCQEVCPKHAISFRNGKSHIDQSLCVKCGRCVNSCPYSAIVKTERPCSMILTCITSAMAGYALAKKRFVGRKLLFTLIVCAMALPKQVILIPLLREMSALNLYNTIWAVIFPIVGWPFGVFLMKQFSEGIPTEMLEAARIDGASEARTFVKIVLPMVKPGIGALAIFTFINSWNDYFMQLIMLSSTSNLTISLGIAKLQAENSTDFGLIMAGAALAAVPIIIIFLIFQKYFTKGIAMGAVKG